MSRIKIEGGVRAVDKFREELTKFYGTLNTNEAVIERLKGECRDTVEDTLTSMRGLHGVTGSLHNGILVAAYINGVYVTSYSSADFINNKPTRKSLKEGEMYDKALYWSGAEAGNHPFEGKVGNESYDVPKEILKTAKSYVPKYRGLCYTIFSGAPYSKYLEKGGTPGDMDSTEILAIEGLEPKAPDFGNVEDIVILEGIRGIVSDKPYARVTELKDVPLA